MSDTYTSNTSLHPLDKLRMDSLRKALTHRLYSGVPKEVELMDEIALDCRIAIELTVANRINHIHPWMRSLNSNHCSTVPRTKILAELPPPTFRPQRDSPEYQTRRSFHSHRVYTIDPEESKYLDDAISVGQFTDPIRLPEHLREQLDTFHKIGVHIADVTHFLQANSPLDKLAQHRSTSHYLVGSVITMLPKLLSNSLCSLEPGVDRFSVSVTFVVDGEGEIVEGSSIWVGRSIIQPFYPQNLDHPEFLTSLVSKDPLPGNGCGLESHQLIEEFMLTANRLVYAFVYSVFPNHTVVRTQQHPHLALISQLTSINTQFGLGINFNHSPSSNEQFAQITNSFQEAAATLPVPIREGINCHLQSWMQSANYSPTASPK
ncbi:putative Ribonuclease [Blattamonas nauphoetae]|uniref:Ribonuclease n=1 Tax=Blattamonas nauphoetae TaxID=2049346 RepID=A0ABQ9YKQ0_9EUKA|nr:putative Ribonuclease [Blattamonas nauphoetae]